MRNKTLMLAGAAAVALTGSGLLAPAAMADPIPPAASYADLLEPVPDAVARLDADDARQPGDAHLIPAQIAIGIGIGHHHHHHHHSARWYRRHGYYWNGQVWLLAPPPPPPPPPYYDRHHHHHHHHQNWR